MKAPTDNKRKLPSTFITGILLTSLLLIPLFSFVQPTWSQPPWWNSSWNFRKPITLNHTLVKADLANFPVLLDITDSDLKGKTQPNGNDIIFTMNNITLDREIEQYDISTGHLVAWVKLPLLSSTTDTELYMYYGNPSAPKPPSPTTVWDSDFKMVQHLEELIGTRFDSTANGSNATTVGTVTKASSGKIDGADVFGSGYERVPAGFLPISAITVELWIRPTSYSTTIYTKFINTGPSTISGIYGSQTVKTADRWTFGLSWDSASKKFFTGDFSPNYAWTHLALTWNGTFCFAYINGAKIKNGTLSGSPDWNGMPLYLGSSYNGAENFKGAIDEVRISNIARSAAWLQTEYNNQKEPAKFHTEGTEESQSSTPLIFENPPNEATEVYTNPTLSANVFDPAGQNMTIVIKERISSTWVILKTYENVPSGTYSANATQMRNLGNTYYWSACANNGETWTNKTYTLTTTAKTLKQKWVAQSLPRGVSGVLAADINHDGKDEVIQAGKSGIVALDGTTGTKIWSLNDSNMGDHAQPQMADLDNDGNLEIVVSLESPAGLLALRANNGSTYWRVTGGLGKETYCAPVVFDIDGNGHPTIFFASTDVTHGLNGTGRLTALSYDGKILRQTFVWRPCSGGLSIADTDGDGEFELYMGDRYMYLNDPIWGDNDYGKGVQSYWARNLTLRWYRPEVFCSSQKPMIADANKDGKLDVIIGDLNGGVAVLNATDGSVIKMSIGIPNDAPTHYQPSIYDIDGDGNLEMMMADPHNTTSDDLVVWDLVKWQVDARIYIGKCFYGPQVADLNGDGLMEIIACNYRSIFIIDKNYRIIDGVAGLSGEVSYGGDVRNIDGIAGLSGTLDYGVVQDIDGDGYTELIVSTQGGSIYAFDTPARRPNPRPRTEVQFYSEYRLGAAEYVQPQSGSAPVISSPSPQDSATEVPFSTSELQFTLTDFQHDLMSYTVTTSPNIGSANEINKGNARYTVPISNLAPSTTYAWTVNATDGIHITMRTYTFITESISPWWNGNWKYCKNLVINHTKVAADLSNFPVLVEITDSDLASKARPDGYDIAFTDANNNKLNSENELYNSATGHIIAWINVPHISSTTDTTINMYYGNPSATNQQNPTAVWDANYAMVLHVKEASGTRYDSTIFANNAIPTGTVTKAAPGKIDGADSFNSNGYERIQQGFLPTSAMTIEIWLKPTSYSPTVWTKFLNTGPTTTRGISGGQTSKTADRWYAGLTWDSGAKSFSTGDITSGYAWNHIVISWNGTYCYAYRNGLKIKEGAISGTPDWLGKPLYLGANYMGTEGLNGAIDEVRVSSTVRSSAWVQTSYNNQKDPATFCAVGIEENAPEAPAVFNPSPPNKATGIPLSLSELSFNLADGQGDLMSYIVLTDPYIGTSSGTQVANGIFTVTVSGLQYSTTYKWQVAVTDGTHWTSVTYTFTTLLSEPPTQDNPLLTIDGGGNLACYNQSTHDSGGDTVTNTYNWYQNSTSLTNLLLPFNTNSSTTVKDYSGYDNNGMIIRGATWIKTGKVGGAYKLDKGFIQIPGTSTLDGNGQWQEITVEHWIYLTSSQPTTTRTIARVPSYEIGLSGNKLFATVWIVTGSSMISGYNKLSTNTTLATSTWYHVALTYKSGVGMTLYLNGVAIGTKAVSGNIQPSGSNPLYIGWFDYFRGMIDEVAIYPKSLSQQQIYQDYMETKDGLSSSSTIISTETHNGDIWKCEVTPNDSYTDGITKASNAVTIGINNAPMAKNLKIAPTTPKTNDDLVAGYTYFDPEGNLESGTEIRWYRNGILQPFLNDILIVPASETNKGDQWHFTVKPKDGTTFGTLQTSPITTILNTAPTINGVTITPDPANPTDTLTANPANPHDADGDTITYTYQWQKYQTGTWVDITGATNQTLTPDNFTTADQIKIICTPYDGQNYGAAKEATIFIS